MQRSHPSRQGPIFSLTASRFSRLSPVHLLQVILWPSFLTQWVTNTKMHKQACLDFSPLSHQSRDLWQRDCCAGQITIRANRTGHVHAHTPSYQKPRRHLVGLLQKHNFSHQCTSMLRISISLQYGYLPKQSQRHISRTNSKQQCNFLTYTIWIQFVIFSAKDQYFYLT